MPGGVTFKEPTDGYNGNEGRTESIPGTPGNSAAGRRTLGERGNRREFGGLGARPATTRDLCGRPSPACRYSGHGSSMRLEHFHRQTGRPLQVLARSTSAQATGTANRRTVETNHEMLSGMCKLHLNRASRRVSCIVQRDDAIDFDAGIQQRVHGPATIKHDATCPISDDQPMSNSTPASPSALRYLFGSAVRRNRDFPLDERRPFATRRQPVVSRYCVACFCASTFSVAM